MEISPFQFGLSCLQFFLYAYLLFLGCRDRRLLRAFPLFYAYVCGVFITGVGRWTVISTVGLDTLFYSKFYHYSLLGSHILQMALLISIYFQVKGRRDREHWLALVSFAALIGWLFVTNRYQLPASERLWEVMAILFQFLMALLVLAQVYWNERLVLGRNHAGLLFGLVLRITLDIVLFVSSAVGLVDYQTIRPWIQPLSILPWLVWAWSMRELSLPVWLSANQVESLQGQQQEFIRTVRELLRRS